jgi:hypothetical protein
MRRSVTFARHGGPVAKFAAHHTFSNPWPAVDEIMLLIAQKI